MRTAQLVYEYPSVSQTFVRSQLEGLAALGCDIRIFAEYEDPLARLHTRSGDDSRVEYFGFPFRRFRESVGKLRAAVARSSAGKTGRSHSESGISKARLRFEAQAFRGQRPFDVIHAHFGPNGVRAVRLRDQGVISGPIVTSFYGYDVGRHWTREGYRSLFEKGDLFIALSEEMRSRLVVLGCPESRLVVHPLGIDVEKFTPCPRAAAANFEILSVARLVPKKGIDFGLRAIRKLLDRGVSLRYTIAGTGELRARLERLARELGIEQSVRFAGAQPNSAVRRLLCASDVLLAPSVTAADGDAEGTPVAILEAQASGIPVVSTLHAGNPEIVDNGRSGFLVRERDVDALADRLFELWERPSLRAEMGCAGRAIVTGRHDIRVLNRRLLGIYEKLAGEAQGITSSTGTASTISPSSGTGSVLDSASSL